MFFTCSRASLKDVCMVVFVVYSSYANPNGQGYNNRYLSYDVVSGIEIMQCIEINKPLVVCRFSENVIK